MEAKDLMRADVFSVRDDAEVGELAEHLMGEHIHGAPVVNRYGELVGVVSQQDIFFSRMTRPTARPAAETNGGPVAFIPAPQLLVNEIMTSPAVSVTEETPVPALCRIMHRLRIHRLPVTRDGKLTGMISSLDVCGAVAEGREV